MPKLVTAGAVADITPEKPACITVGNEVIAVFNCGGAFYAINNRCPHAGAPLSEGFTEGTRVTCAWHGWTIEMDPRKCPRADGVDRYNVVVEDGMVKVELEN